MYCLECVHSGTEGAKVFVLVSGQSLEWDKFVEPPPVEKEGEGGPPTGHCHRLWGHTREEKFDGTADAEAVAVKGGVTGFGPDAVANGNEIRFDKRDKCGGIGGWFHNAQRGQRSSSRAVSRIRAPHSFVVFIQGMLKRATGIEVSVKVNAMEANDLETCRWGSKVLMDGIVSSPDVRAEHSGKRCE
ncbi:hypothetical protein FISHEDRAFT_68577 [Fistulina hepatica ATCC 64428]|uniref:Uncharacterized protein n=1 Tax=Fistulina hepatica ATCC 64428 TaxID=1128425 RepID=A0A0D7APV2_9AGAR|nr:hypothetical protein FISHEDRAFT_68577 [Fistulina hepatica ATCC 64428]